MQIDKTIFSEKPIIPKLNTIQCVEAHLMDEALKWVLLGSVSE